jgi:hypothetical protein
VYLRLCTRQSDEEAMGRFREAHPEYVHANKDEKKK